MADTPQVQQGMMGAASGTSTPAKKENPLTKPLELKKIPLEQQVMELRLRLIRIEEFLRTKYTF